MFLLFRSLYRIPLTVKTAFWPHFARIDRSKSGNKCWQSLEV